MISTVSCRCPKPCRNLCHHARLTNSDGVQLDENMRMPQIESLISKDLYGSLKNKLSPTFVWTELKVSEVNHRLKAFPELQDETGLKLEAAALIAHNIECYGSPDW